MTNPKNVLTVGLAAATAQDQGVNGTVLGSHLPVAFGSSFRTETIFLIVGYIRLTFCLALSHKVDL